MSTKDSDMTRLLCTLILGAFAAVSAQAASHAGAAPAKASAPMKNEEKKEMKAGEKKEMKAADTKASAPKK
jgi:ribosomal protein L12E/L44/L45/RPP1/RPP2